MNSQPSLTSDILWEPLYRKSTEPLPIERELLLSRPVRRLKHLHHYGAGALIGPVVHSRLDHTLGVWALTAAFFPDDTELRLAALLHDVGHLPFSHAVERHMRLRHHDITRQLILESEIAPLLRKHGISPAAIVRLLDSDSPLTSQNELLGIDHLDSFIRDTWMLGCCPLEPGRLIETIRMTDGHVDTDEATALLLFEAITRDHKTFLSPLYLGVDALLGAAVRLYREEDSGFGGRLAWLTDAELLAKLETSRQEAVRETIRILLWEPHRIVESADPFIGAVPVDVRNVYAKQPLIGGRPAAEVSAAAKEKLKALGSIATGRFIGYR